MRSNYLTLSTTNSFPFDSLFKEFEQQLMPYHMERSSELIETNEAYLAAIDMPGVASSDISLCIEDKKLMISAERKSPFDKDNKTIYKYTRNFNIPKNVDIEKINANYENGVLYLTLNKLPEHLTRKKIEVTSGAKPSSWTKFLSFGKSESTPAVN